MTRSQQMDELLDVLIESGGTHCFSDPSRASPLSGVDLRGPELLACLWELPKLGMAFICCPTPGAHTEVDSKSIWGLCW